MAMLRHWSAIVALMMSTASYAHEDTLFEIEEDGELSGMPVEFRPARLMISPKSESPQVVLTLSGVESVLPECLSRLFVLPVGEEVAVAGSWYHTRSKLPPYLSIRLPTRTSRASGFYDGYNLLFDLKTAKLIRIHRTKFGENENTIRGEEIAPDAICGQDELVVLKPRPAA